jgi:ACS family tartrate transporter-like MFS transporter
MKKNLDVFGRAAWRLIPFLMLLYVVSFLDRVNVGFAALTMNADLNFSAELYGFGAGMFFWGYFLFEVPSNLIMEKLGARLWICRIMVSWGIISMAMAAVTGPTAFVALRFLLGVAEAGFFPGILLYLTYWFPSAMRARFIALFLAGVPLASVIGAPISGLILEMDDLHGLQGWQWMFLIEGAPSVLLGLLVLKFLPDGPKKAAWLSPEEKSTVIAALEAEPPPTFHRMTDMLLDRRVWLLCIPDFGIVLALYGFGLWLPQIVKAMGFSNLQTGFVVALPYAVAMAAMVLLGLSSDRRNERVLHVSAACVVAAIGFFVAALSSSVLVQLIALTFAAAGIYGALAVFWTLPPSFLGGTAAAGGIALINSIANLGGFFGPSLIGWIKDHTGGYAIGMAALGVGLCISAMTVVMVGRKLNPSA